MTRDDIREQLEDDEQVCFLEGPEFDSALLGLLRDHWGRAPLVVVYSRAGCIAVLEAEMSYEDAYEYFSFNVEGAYVGSHTPVFL